MNTTDEILTLAGLEPLAHEDLYPLLVKDGDEAWLTIVRGGKRVWLGKVTHNQLLVLAKQGIDIALEIGPR